MADQRILRAVSATLTWQPVDSSGEAADPSGVVTVKVTSSDGTEILAAGTATGGSGSQPRTVALTAAQTVDLDLLTAVWTDAGDSSTYTTTSEIVGGYFFTLAEARASDPALTNDTKFSTDKLLEARAVVEDEFERICQVAFVPRFAVETVTASSSLRLRWALPRAIRSVEWLNGDSVFVDWDHLATTRLTEGGFVDGCFQPGAVYRVAYEHGYDQPPAEVKTAAMVRLRDRASVALRGIPDRATSFAVAEGGSYRLDQAGVDKTGMPDVDAVLMRYERRSRVA